MNRKPIIALAAGLGFLLLAPFAIAGAGTHMGPGFCHHGGHPQNAEEASEKATKMAGFFANKIDATEEQTTTLEGIASDRAVSMFALREQGVTLHENLEEVMSEGANREELEGLRQTFLQLVDNGTSQALDTMLEVRGVLTEEQRQQVWELHQQRREGGGPPWMR